MGSTGDPPVPSGDPPLGKETRGKHAGRTKLGTLSNSDADRAVPRREHAKGGLADSGLRDGSFVFRIGFLGSRNLILGQHPRNQDRAEAEKKAHRHGKDSPQIFVKIIGHNARRIAADSLIVKESYPPGWTGVRPISCRLTV